MAILVTLVTRAILILPAYLSNYSLSAVLSFFSFGVTHYVRPTYSHVHDRVKQVLGRSKLIYVQLSGIILGSTFRKLH